LKKNIKTKNIETMLRVLKTDFKPLKGHVTN